MKKLFFLLALLLLLTGCGKNTVQPPASPALPTETAQDSTENDSPEFNLVTFDIYAINDLHGKLADTEQQPGVDELSTYLKQAQQAGNTILLATGDMWQGASESNLTRGFIVTEWMNEMDFTAMTMGGHEYDWGEDLIRQNKELAEFPFLAINVYSRETDRQVDYCQSSLIVEAEGVQIGIIGAMGDCYSSISSEFSKDVYFLTGDRLTELVKAESEKLRSEGADFIIYTIHDGYDRNYAGTGSMTVGAQELHGYYDTVLSDGYVDLVFEADSHFTYVLMDQHGVYHLQNGGNNQGISHVQVVVDGVNGDFFVLEAELIPGSMYSFLEDDPIVEELLEKYKEQVGPAARILGSNSQYRSGKQICQLVADLYCEKGVEKWADTYDIVLGGGYISCRSPGYMPEGEVSYSQLMSLLPFDNQITLCSIQGRDLISKFLQTDNRSYYIKLSPYGESVRSYIDPNGTYYVVTDSYSAYYTPNNLTVVEVYSEDIFARDLLADHIAAGGLG